MQNSIKLRNYQKSLFNFLKTPFYKANFAHFSEKTQLMKAVIQNKPGDRSTLILGETEMIKVRKFISQIED